MPPATSSSPVTGGHLQKRRAGESDRKRQRSPDGSATKATTAAAARPPAARLHHPFKANFNDHFETSREALQDIYVVVEELRSLTRPSTPDSFTIYDPYFCVGGVVQHWASLGVSNVLHANRDFYADIENGTVPGPFDMIVTNPPFSEDHILRMLRFLTSQTQPWAFVAPDYIATKPWYVQFLQESFSPAPPTGKGDITAPCGALKRLSTTATASSSLPSSAGVPSLQKFELPPFLRSTPAVEDGGVSQRAAVGVEPFYIVPQQRYDYQHPLGVGHDHSHFKSIWYVWAGRRTGDVVRAAKVALAKRSGGGGRAAPAVLHGLQSLQESGLIASTEKRQNPRQRARVGRRRGR